MNHDIWLSPIKEKMALIDFDYNNEEECIKAIEEDPRNISYIENQTEEMCMLAVSKDGYLLRYVRDQTPEICLAAIKQRRSSIAFVHDNILKEISKDVCELNKTTNIYH